MSKQRVLRLAEWFRSHPLTSGFLALVVFAVGAHLFANWRAEVRWQRYCTEARARGVKLTLAEFAQPEIPDAENFAALPMFKAIFAGGVQQPMRLPTKTRRPDFGDPVKGIRVDWIAWQTYFKDVGFIAETTDSPPRDVLRALDHYAPQFKEWSEWRTRPRSRFPLDYNTGIDIELPHLDTFSDATRLCSLRMRAHLALGDSAAAYADYCESFQGFLALNDEPTLVPAMVQAAVINGMNNSVGDGLRDHAWADAELAMIEKGLSTVKLWQRYRLALQSDRAVNNLMYDRYTASSPMERWKLYTDSLNGAPSPPIMSAIKFMPRRLFRDNQLRHNHWTDELLTRFDPDGATPSGPRNWSTWIDAFYYYLFRMTALPNEGTDQRFFYTQTKLDQTRIAIALERCRLARGAYPETLVELVPEFITEVPVDTYSRQPMSYRRKEGGTFLLYGWGTDRKDDRGVVDSKIEAWSQLDDIWLYAPAAP